MILNWLNARDASDVGNALADQFAPKTSSAQVTTDSRAGNSVSSEEFKQLLQRADREVGALRLNFYKKAKFANSFKWRLLENGIDKETADEVTQRLIMHLFGNQAGSTERQAADAKPAFQQHSSSAKQLLEQGNRCISRGAYTEAIDYYQELIRIDPRHVSALNNLGAALSRLGRYKESEGYFNRAIKAAPDFPDAHSNVGVMLLMKGQYLEAEGYLRRALKLNPRFSDARINLGLALAFLGQLRDAKSHFEKVLKVEPRNAEAMFGMAVVAKTNGDFARAETLLNSTLRINPNMPNALAAQAGLRKMTAADGPWLRRAEDVAASRLEPVKEAEIRFAIGKYFDDIEDFERAFKNYKRANDLLKPIAEPYSRETHKGFVDNLIQIYTADVVGKIGPGASSSSKPVLVVGMPRSGTSLTEQIIASHPSAAGAGELQFWAAAVRENVTAIQSGPIGESTRNKLTEAYLRILDSKSSNSLRVVDKAPVNADYLGLIHSVFPNARIIYMRRDPIDTCLSCFFQKFVLSLNFTMELSDLVDYYRQHERLMEHWRAVLPAGTILDVPYEELVADQYGWTRKILEFLNLEWDERCINFYETNRAVVTASFWQVRQKIYTNSVHRWHHYEQFIKPLLALRTSSS